MNLTAIVLSATKQAISGQTVTFSTGSDDSAFVNNVSASGVSDANGTVTAQLNVGTDKSNRTIAVSAAVGAVTTTNDVAVTGTTLTVSGNSSLAFDASTQLTYSVKDSAGAPIPGVTLNVASQTGNTIVLTPSTGVTNTAGQISAMVTASQSGNDVITATGAGISVTQALTVSPDNFVFTAPAANIDIPLGTSQTVSINWLSNGAIPTLGTLVNFSSSRGTITGSPAGTDGSGNASVTVSPTTTAGPVIITASGPKGTPAATLNVNFVATTADSVTTQAVPGVVGYTTGSASQTNNTSTISVVVRDSNNNLVKNAYVTFKIVKDPSAGKLSSGNGTTDISGSASVIYTAGETSSPLGGVSISATVSSVNGTLLPAPLTDTTTLTVAGQASLVRIGTDNLVGVGTNTPTYTKTWTALVTDTANNPVPGATVRFDLRPIAFAKGYQVWNATAGEWVIQPQPLITCANEDINFDGIIQPGEDINGNGMLDPGGAASVTASSVTDASGNATAVITYPKSYARWAEYSLEARTGVTGNDPPTVSLPFWLSGLAADYTNQNVPPPGVDSPYGTTLGTFGTLCSNTN